MNSQACDGLTCARGRRAERAPLAEPARAGQARGHLLLLLCHLQHLLRRRARRARAAPASPPTLQLACAGVQVRQSPLPFMASCAALKMQGELKSIGVKTCPLARRSIFSQLGAAITNPGALRAPPRPLTCLVPQQSACWPGDQTIMRSACCMSACPQRPTREGARPRRADLPPAGHRGALVFELLSQLGADQGAPAALPAGHVLPPPPRGFRAPASQLCGPSLVRLVSAGKASMRLCYCS